MLAAVAELRGLARLHPSMARALRAAARIVELRLMNGSPGLVTFGLERPGDDDG
jgi:hypothetical protein